MGLGTALFGKKSKTTESVLAKKQEAVSPSSLKNTNVFSGGAYKTKKDLQGKLGSLKMMKVKGSTLKKDEWTTLMTDLVKARDGKITVGQLERDLYLKKHIPQRERARIMGWAKKNFVKVGVVRPVSSRRTRKIDTKQTLASKSFVSPKDRKVGSVMNENSQANSLGMKDEGFKMGHGRGSSSRVAKNKAQGLTTQTGATGITRSTLRNAGGASLNLGAKPRNTGL